MKVGTDGVLLGAWSPVGDSLTVWDVGSGSGLIALMIAQRSKAHIYGVEIDDAAYHEMLLNFKNSPWSDRLHGSLGDINDVSSFLPCPDLIISNPPFFVNSLAADGAERNLARHQLTLGPTQLVDLAAQYLSDRGVLAMIAPVGCSEQIEWTATLQRLGVIMRTDVRMSENKPVSRSLWLIGRDYSVTTVRQTVSLRDFGGDYSQWYRQLTDDYYLHLK